MTFKKLKYYSFFLSLLLIQSCTGQTDDKGKPKIWKSKYFEFSLEFTHPWTQLPSFDTSEKSLFGVMDYNDGKSYIVKIANDVSKDILSDSIYFDFTKNTILSENDNNILLDELDTMYHGEKFHCMTFLIKTKKWGNMKQYAYIYRDGKKMLSIQISFPVDEKNAQQVNIPEALKELDKNVKINGR